MFPLPNGDKLISKRKSSIAELKVIEMDILFLKRENGGFKNNK